MKYFHTCEFYVVQWLLLLSSVQLNDNLESLRAEIRDATTPMTAGRQQQGKSGADFEHSSRSIPYTNFLPFCRGVV